MCILYYVSRFSCPYPELGTGAAKKGGGKGGCSPYENNYGGA